MLIMKQSPLEAKKNTVGSLGEDLAVKYLKSKGFSIIEQNFRMKLGEIDIICEKSGITHFVEVKTVSRETNHSKTNNIDEYRPEDKMNETKVLRQKRVIESYLHQLSEIKEINFQVDLISVILNKNDKTAKISLLSDIIL